MDERKRSLRKEIVRLALPIALQQFMTALVGACDAIMLGKLSQDAMSSFAGVEIPVKDWYIDFLISSAHRQPSTIRIRIAAETTGFP